MNKEAIKAAFLAFRGETLAIIKSKASAIATLCKALRAAGMKSETEIKAAVRKEVAAVNALKVLKYGSESIKSDGPTYSKTDVSRGFKEAGFASERPNSGPKKKPAAEPAEKLFKYVSSLAESTGTDAVTLLKAALKLAEKEAK